MHADSTVLHASLYRLQAGDSCAQVGFRRIPVAVDRLVLPQQTLHRRTLRPGAAAMNEAYDREPRLAGGVQILIDHRHDVTRMKRVQVDGVFDGEANRLVLHYLLYSAVTRVVSPPRAVKSPMTVMRRGDEAATRSSRILLVTAS